MAEIPATNPLVQRLAVRRLVAPGVLDRRTLQRLQERFAHPSSTPLLGRLYRRMASAEPNAAGLPLARAYRSAEPDTASSLSSDSDSTSVSTAAHDRSNGGSGADLSLARQAAGVSSAGEFVAQRAVTARGLIDGDRTVSRLIERSSKASPESSAISHGAIASGVVQRVANDGAAAVSTGGRTLPRLIGRPGKASPESSSISHNAVAGGVVQRVANDGAAAVSTVVGALRPMLVAGAGTSSVTQDTSATKHRPVVMRKAATTASATAVLQAKESTGRVAEHGSRNAAAAHAAPASPTVAGISTPLLWRKPDAVAAPQVAGSLPTITTAASAVIAREAAAPVQTPTPDQPMHAPASTSAVAMDIDWITEQVGSRLARRLEIERERLGVRPWRQVS